MRPLRLTARRAPSPGAPSACIVTTGDASVAAAAKAGGIDTVAYVDHSFVNYVGVYSK